MFLISIGKLTQNKNKHSLLSSFFLLFLLVLFLLLTNKNSQKSVSCGTQRCSRTLRENKESSQRNPESLTKDETISSFHIKNNLREDCRKLWNKAEHQRNRHGKCWRKKQTSKHESFFFCSFRTVPTMRAFEMRSTKERLER
jgi:hypothetical protein